MNSAFEIPLAIKRNNIMVVLVLVMVMEAVAMIIFA